MEKKNINIALSPNSTGEDVWEAISRLILPWKWAGCKTGKSIGRLEMEFKRYLAMKYVFSMNSGREALYAILNSIGLEKGDEVIIQSFTCMVVINSIVWNDLKPVYVDIDADDYNLDPKKLEKKITPKTKVVMIQHTFGIPANIEKIQAICKKHKLILIEDCAHALGAKYQNKKVGTFGDISFFSLGRSKVISCVSGGIIATSNDKYGELIKKSIQGCPYPSYATVTKNLLHPIVFEIVKHFYNKAKLGKIILVGMQKLKLLTLEVEKNEKRGRFKKPYPKRLPNALAAIGLKQFDRLIEFNNHRINLARQYYKALQDVPNIKCPDPIKYSGAIFLRYPIRVKNKEEFLDTAKDLGIVLGDWYSAPIAPLGINESKTSYKSSQCPVAERICKMVVNLPTHHAINEKEVQEILGLFKKETQENASN